MPRWIHPEDEPQPGDAIQLLDAAGMPSSSYSRVQQLLAEDRREELWEIKDNRGRVLVVTDGGVTWLEILMTPDAGASG